MPNDSMSRPVYSLGIHGYDPHEHLLVYSKTTLPKGWIGIATPMLSRISSKAVVLRRAKPH